MVMKWFVWCFVLTSGAFAKPFGPGGDFWSGLQQSLGHIDSTLQSHLGGIQQQMAQAQGATNFATHMMKTTQDHMADLASGLQAQQQSQLNPFSLFGPFLQPSVLEWWRGPNVCMEQRQEKSENDFMSAIGGSAFTMVSCNNAGQRYECNTRITTPEGQKSQITVYECCQGFFRDLKTGGFCVPAPTESVEQKVEQLGGGAFLGLVKSVGVTDHIRKNNLTLFLPSQDSVDDFRRRKHENVVHPLDARPIRRRRETNEVHVPEQVVTGDTEVDMRDVVLSHFTNQIVDVADFINEKVLYSDANNSTIRINHYEGHRSGPVTTVNCATMTASNQWAHNGVIHQLDRMLAPITRTVGDVIASQPDLEVFKTLMEKTDAYQRLSNPQQHLTIFAPSDAAFRKLDQVKRARIYDGDSCLNTVLQYHVMPRTVCSAAIQEGVLLGPSLLKLEPLQLERREGKLLAGHNESHIISRDIVATNGVIHIVDDVLIPPAARSVSEVLHEANLTSFIRALETAGMMHYIDTMKNVTLFAPSNEALSKHPLVMTEIESNPSKARDLVNLHIASPELLACDMAREQMLPSMLMNKPLRLQVHSPMPGFLGAAATTATVQCARIRQFDGQACGAVVHVIDDVLSPAPFDVFQTVTDRYPGELQMFRELLTLSGISHEISGEGPFTILAPTDDAFRAMPPAMLSNLRSDAQLAKNFVHRHVLLGAICCNSVTRSYWSLPSYYYNMEGTTVPLHRDHNDRVYAASSARIIECDKIATNGIVHKIDQVLHMRTPSPGRRSHSPRGYFRIY